MEKQIYITQEERKNCIKVSNAFDELYGMTDTIVINTGKYGFAKLKCYDCETGFQDITTYTRSADLFEDLWQEWIKEHLFLLAVNTPLIELDYKNIFEALSEEEQKKIIDKKDYFQEKQRQAPEYEDTKSSKNQTEGQSYITEKEKERCKIIADIFSDLEKDNIILQDAGRYGFVMLAYYEPPVGFESVITFTDSQKMFNTLWEEWFISRIVELQEEMGMSDLDYEVFYERLSDEKKEELKSQKQKFIEKARIMDNAILRKL